MKKILLLILVLSCLASGCVYSRYWERIDGQPMPSEREFKKEAKECFYRCWYSEHWKSTRHLSIPIYGYFYNWGYQFSSLKDKEEKATSECFDRHIKEKGYQRKANVR